MSLLRVKGNKWGPHVGQSGSGAQCFSCLWGPGHLSLLCRPKAQAARTYWVVLVGHRLQVTVEMFRYSTTWQPLCTS